MKSGRTKPRQRQAEAHLRRLLASTAANVVTLLREGGNAYALRLAGGRVVVRKLGRP